MKKLKLIFLFLLSVGGTLTAQTDTVVPACKLLSSNVYQGNHYVGIDLIYTRPENNNIRVLFSNNSDTCDIPTYCLPIGGYTEFIYDSSYTNLIATECLPWADWTESQSLHYFPQPDGDTILFGTTNVSVEHAYDIAIDRRRADGSLVWAKRYGGEGPEATFMLRAATDGTYIASTPVNSLGGDVGFHYGDYFLSDNWVLKIDTAGEIVWKRVLGGTGNDFMRYMLATDDGGCILFGYSDSDDHDCISNHGNSDLWVARLDGAGNTLWSQCYGGNAFEGGWGNYGVRAVKDDNGGYYVLSCTYSHNGDVQYRMPKGLDWWLLHIDSAGTILWERTYGGGGDDVQSAIARSPDGSLWLGGNVFRNADSAMVMDYYGADDAWVLHVDSMGNPLSQRVIGSSREDDVRTMYALYDGTVLVAGWTNGADTGVRRSPGLPVEKYSGVATYLFHLSPEPALSIQDTTPSDIDWAVYPNPAKTGQVNVSVPKEIGIITLQVSDATGKTIYQKEHSGNFTLNTSNWKSSIYFFNIITDKGYSYTKKISLL